jgi:hypothetical protein
MKTSVLKVVVTLLFLLQFGLIAYVWNESDSHSHFDYADDSHSHFNYADGMHSH